MSVNLTKLEVKEHSGSLLFSRMFPHLDLDQHTQQGLSKALRITSEFKISQSSDYYQLELRLPVSSLTAFRLLSSPHNYYKFMKFLEAFEVLVRLTEENACTVHEVYASRSFFEAGKELLFLRHGFRHGPALFLLDLSLKDPQFRSYWSRKPHIFNLWGFYPFSDSSCQVVAKFFYQPGQEAATLEYVEDLTAVAEYCKFISEESLDEVLDPDWYPARFFSARPLLLEGLVQSETEG
jgi:hypothetical protein